MKYIIYNPYFQLISSGLFPSDSKIIAPSLSVLKIFEPSKENFVKTISEGCPNTLSFPQEITAHSGRHANINGMDDAFLLP